MPESDPIARSTDGPVTRDWLIRDLSALGLPRGGVLMVHASLTALGWVVGGAETLAGALRAVLGPEGTLVVPTFTGGNSDPADWRHPPVPESWWATIRAEMPAYDPRTSQSRMMGRLSEFVRSLPGAVRSEHPSSSWAAIGPQAEALMADHALEQVFGERSPVARCLAAGAHVLSLGTERTSLLHHAEHLASWPGKRTRAQGAAATIDGERRWLVWNETDWLDDDFEALRRAYMATSGDWQEGPVGYGRARRFAAAPLVAFAVGWIERNRS